MFPEGAAPTDAEALGGVVFGLTYGSASSFKSGPTVGYMVKLVLTSMLRAYGKRTPVRKAK